MRLMGWCLPKLVPLRVSRDSVDWSGGWVCSRVIETTLSERWHDRDCHINCVNAEQHTHILRVSSFFLVRSQKSQRRCDQQNSVLCHPFGDLGVVTNTVQLWLVGKRVVHLTLRGLRSGNEHGSAVARWKARGPLDTCDCRRYYWFTHTWCTKARLTTVAGVCRRLSLSVTPHDGPAGDLFLWFMTLTFHLLTPKIYGFPGLAVQRLCVKFGDPMQLLRFLRYRAEKHTQKKAAKNLSL